MAGYGVRNQEEKKLFVWILSKYILVVAENNLASHCSLYKKRVHGRKATNSLNINAFHVVLVMFFNHVFVEPQFDSDLFGGFLSTKNWLM